jgi:hypothetical protein
MSAENTNTAGTQKKSETVGNSVTYAMPKGFEQACIWVNLQISNNLIFEGPRTVCEK